MSEIERLRALLAEATPGPWHAHRQPDGSPWWIESEDEHSVADVERAQDAAVIATAVNALPALLDVAEAWADLMRYGEAHDYRTKTWWATVERGNAALARLAR